MSIESANRFLEAIAHDGELRTKFTAVQTPDDFLRLVEQLGYSFTTEELYRLLHDHSDGVIVRRDHGVWKWLRQTNWRS